MIAVLKIDSIYRMRGHLSEIINPKRDMKVWLLCQLGNRIDVVGCVRGWINKGFDNDDNELTVSLKFVEILKGDQIQFVDQLNWELACDQMG